MIYAIAGVVLAGLMMTVDMVSQFQRKRGPLHAAWCRRRARRIWRMAR